MNLLRKSAADHFIWHLYEWSQGFVVTYHTFPCVIQLHITSPILNVRLCVYLYIEIGHVLCVSKIYVFPYMRSRLIGWCTQVNFCVLSYFFLSKIDLTKIHQNMTKREQCAWLGGITVHQNLSNNYLITNSAIVHDTVQWRIYAPPGCKKINIEYKIHVPHADTCIGANYTKWRCTANEVLPSYRTYVNGKRVSDNILLQATTSKLFIT